MTVIKHRRGTQAQWAASNRVLADGEKGFERDRNRFKIGDGTKTWSQLKYFVDEAQVAAIVAEALAELGPIDSEITMGSNPPDNTTAGSLYLQKT